MRSDRGSFLLGLAGFLAGVFFTLFITEFLGPKAAASWLERKLLLLVLLLLFIAVLRAYAMLARTAASAGSSVATGADWETVPRKEATAALPQGDQGGRREVNGGRSEIRDGARNLREPLEAPLPARRLEPAITSPARIPQGSSGYQVSDQSSEVKTPSENKSAHPGRLIEIWERYYREGDGKFNAGGLRRQMEEAGITADVIPGDRIGAGESLLAIDLHDGTNLLYLLPNFGKPVRAVDNWFQSVGGESRVARIQRLLRPATARRAAAGIVLETKGEVE